MCCEYQNFDSKCISVDYVDKIYNYRNSVTISEINEYSSCTNLILRKFVIVLVFFSSAMIENNIISIIVFRVICPLSSCISNLSARVHMFFGKEPSGMRPLISRSVMNWKGLQGSKPECSQSETDSRECELYWKWGHLFLTQRAVNKLIVWYHFFFCRESTAFTLGRRCSCILIIRYDERNREKRITGWVSRCVAKNRMFSYAWAVTKQRFREVWILYPVKSRTIAVPIASDRAFYW